MKDKYRDRFVQALIDQNLEELKHIPKSDLHNHFVLGGSRRYIYEKAQTEILPCEGILHSMQEMDAWNTRYIGARFDSSEMRKLLIEAAFVQAKEDNIRILEIGEDVWR